MLTRTGLLGVLVVAILAGHGCADGDSSTQASKSKPGPLTSDLRDGGNSLIPPKERPTRWDATFGSLLLCGDRPAVIDAVVPHYAAGEPIAAAFSVRTAPATSERHGAAVSWVPILARTTSLRRLVDDEGLRSSSLVAAEGALVDQRCSDDPDASFTEIVTSMEVDARGAWIDHLDVRYTADDQQYTLRVNWNYVACGTDTTDPQVC